MPLFTKEPNQYKRDLDMRKHYIDDAALYWSKRTGKSIAECRSIIERGISAEGRFPFKDPRMAYLAKETPGNRELYTSTVTEYLEVVSQRQCILAPNMTAYLNPDERESLLAKYIQGNLQKRKDVKKKMFVAQMAGDTAAENFYNILQTTYKVKNNSLSGAHASASTPLYNKSSHSSLTSLCRCASGIANANNERFLAGNRHYYDPDITLTNIVSVVNHSDYEIIQRVMDRYSLVYPSVEQTLSVIRRSTDLYWTAKTTGPRFQTIADFVATLTPLERAAYCYTGDFYHLRVFNDGFMRKFLSDLITPRVEPVADPKGAIAALDDDEYALVGLMCGKVLNGATIKNIVDEGGARLEHIGKVAAGVQSAIASYADLYAAFIVTDNVPASLAEFPTSVRRTAVISDTDSTIFTVQDWVQWYRGQIDFSEESNALTAIIVYLTSQIVKHYLAVISGNMGVALKYIHRVSMKNEYLIPVLGLTTRAKHYYGYLGAREGNVYVKPKLEVKGVALRSSKVPDAVMAGATELMTHVLDTILAGQLIDLEAILKSVADREREITQSILQGDTRYLTTAQVKAPEFYTNPESSPYTNYVLWEDVFADTYGHSDPPPFFAIKASVTADNKTKFNEWIESIEDTRMQERLRQWAERYGKDKLTTIMLPANIVSSSGVPKEIARIIDTRKIVYNTMEAYYLVLESLGYFINVGDAITNLVSDRH